MNWEMVAGLLRHLLTFGGGFLVAKGLVDAETMTTAVSGVLSVVAVLWSLWVKKKA